MSEESKNWYRMTRPLFNSGFEDDEFWAYGQDGFQEILDSFLGSDVLVYEKCLWKEPTNVRAIIQNVTSDVANSAMLRQILCPIGTLRCGQYVRIDSAYWLVSALPDNNRIYEKAILWKCKYTLRFISPLTGEIVEYPIYDENSTQYGTGESKKTQLTVGDAQHLIYIPYNEETILIDNRFRFLMDRNRENPTAFRVAQVDTTSRAVGSESEDGLLQWSVIETQFNERTDNRELMIADYFTAVNTADDQPSGGRKVILTDTDGDWTITAGETKIVKMTCFDAGGIEVPDAIFIAEIVGEDAVEIEEVDKGELLIQARNNRNAIGKTVQLRVMEAGGAEAQATITVSGW